MDHKNSEKRQVTLDDCPLACPTPEMTAWNAHPRVFLPIEEKKEVSCPYCGTTFQLVESE